MTARKLIITGKSGSGKTHFCTGVVNALRQGDLTRVDIRGILSPELEREGEKVGIQAVNLVTFEHKNLAEPNDGTPSPISTKRWRFDAKVIKWCNSVLSGSVPCEVLIVDEIGPLEFEQGEGFVTGLEAVDSGDYKLALVVIRSHLLERGLQRWPDAEVLDAQNKADAKNAMEEIIRMFENRNENRTKGFWSSED